MKFLTLVALLIGLVSCGGKLKKEAIEAPLPATQTVAGKELIIQGQGFRIGSKLGFTAKVYKVALYTDQKYNSGQEVLDSNSPKKLYMRFTYTVTKLQMVEGWEKAYKHSCEKKCVETQPYFKEFLDAVSGMKIGQIMEIEFHPQKVVVTITKETPQVTTISSGDFSYNLLSVFIGKKVLDEKFKKALLSQN